MRLSPATLALIVLCSGHQAEAQSTAASKPGAKPASLPASQASRPVSTASRPAKSTPVARPLIQNVHQKPRRSSPRPQGRIAVLNLGGVGEGGWRLAQKAQRRLAPYAGGWARHRGVAEHLLAMPHAQTLPSADAGRRLGPMLNRLRNAIRPSVGDLWRLGNLLNVDYLLLIKARRNHAVARIFSVRAQAFGPSGISFADQKLSGLLSYVGSQTRMMRPKKAPKAKGRQRWWVWAIAGAVAVLSIGYSIANQRDSVEGPLTIRVSR